MLRQYSFGVLVSAHEGELWTTHLPYRVMEDGGVIEVHMARANPHWQALEAQGECRLVVQGEHAYVSPSWYATAKSVPTWNYEAVHVDATAEVVQDTDDLWTMVAAMSDRFEEPDSSWDYNGLPEPFRAAMLEAIVGVRLHVRAGQAKAKLSQNRSEPERRRVAEELRERGTGALATRMLAMFGDHNEEDGQ
jgi:transcriptional regulator